MNIMVTPKRFTLPPLPYDDNALEPTIPARTMGIHYRKHHKAYADKLNELVRGTEYARMTLDDVVKATFADPSKLAMRTVAPLGIVKFASLPAAASAAFPLKSTTILRLPSSRGTLSW